MIVGHVWSKYAGKDMAHSVTTTDERVEHETSNPSALKAFLPILIPIILIALRSFLLLQIPVGSKWLNIVSLGDPVIALLIGVLLAFLLKQKWTGKAVSILLHESVEKAAGILVIIGAGGAFGAVLAATKIGDHFSNAVTLESLGLLFPFLLTFILKTAQGSSTVAIITASSIVFPLLISLGLDSENGKLLTVLSMGAGSMMISHANDAYFWVITKFSGLNIKTTFKVYSVASVLMGLTTLFMVYLLSWILS